MVLPAPTMETSPPPRRLRGYRPAPLRATRHKRVLENLTFAAAPMLLAASSLTLGILDARWIWHPPLLSLLAAVLAAGLTLIAIWRAPRTVLFSVALLWFAAGQFCARVVPVRAPRPLLFQLADGLQRNATGTVTAIHSPRTVTRNRPFGASEQTEQTQQIDLSL